MKVIKFFGYWFVYSTVTSFLAALSNLVTQSEGLTIFLILGALGASMYLAHKKVYGTNRNSTSENCNKIETPHGDMSFEVKVTGNSNYEHYEKRNYSDAKIAEVVSKLSNSANKTIQKNMEITPEGEESEIVKNVISGSYKEKLQSFDKDIDEISNTDVVLYSLLQSKTRIKEHLDLSKSVSSVYLDGLNLLKGSNDYIQAGEYDKESLADEWRERFSEEVLEKCFHEHHCGYNFLESYIENVDQWDYSIFDELGFNSSKLVLDTCSYQMQREGVFKCASDSYQYRELKKLSKLGVVLNGNDISANSLMHSLKVKDIRELAKAKNIVIKARKKEDLIEAFLGQAKITTGDIGKFIAIRELFSLNKDFLNKHNISANKHTWEKHKIDSDYIEDRIYQVAESKYLKEKVTSSFRQNFIKSLSRKTAA